MNIDNQLLPHHPTAIEGSNWKLEDTHTDRAVARALIGGGGGIFIYSCYARRISFEISCF